MSKWEIENCPWWIDYPDGCYPANESDLYKTHKGRGKEIEVMEIQSIGGDKEHSMTEEESSKRVKQRRGVDVFEAEAPSEGTFVHCKFWAKL